jgi:hypothetical protein
MRFGIHLSEFDAGHSFVGEENHRKSFITHATLETASFSELIFAIIPPINISIRFFHQLSA